jgi:hypothetical protein
MLKLARLPRDGSQRRLLIPSVKVNSSLFCLIRRIKKENLANHHVTSTQENPPLGLFDRNHDMKMMELSLVKSTSCSAAKIS